MGNPSLELRSHHRLGSMRGHGNRDSSFSFQYSDMDSGPGPGVQLLCPAPALCPTSQWKHTGVRTCYSLLGQRSTAKGRSTEVGSVMSLGLFWGTKIEALTTPNGEGKWTSLNTGQGQKPQSQHDHSPQALVMAHPSPYQISSSQAPSGLFIQSFR